MDEIAPRPPNAPNPRGKLHLDSTKIEHWKHRERLEAWRRGERIAPITVDMALTQKCSFSCEYCYAGLQFNKASPEEWATYQNLLDDFTTIGHASGEGVRGVSLVSDGESTENPYFRDFVLYGKSKGIDMAVGTNGLKLNPDLELIRAFTYARFNISAGEREAYKQVMGVSDKQWEGALESIRESIRIKRENNLETTIGLQMVLLPEYADQVIPLALLGRDLKADYTVIKHCSDDEKGSLGVDYSWYKTPLALTLLKTAEALSIDDYSVQAKWTKMMTGRDRRYSKCFGTPLMLQMSGTCIVAPCGSFFGKDYSRYHIGNYSRERFKDIWASDKYWEVIGHLGSDKFNPQKMCATLCLQDKVNEVVYGWVENGVPLRDTDRAHVPQHINFI
ncbi:SPASM domain-containing protein [Candidatus Pacearchaeota archaeon]|nr:SPASM domain-containing protein [Candidatus Pacearchaeota archaeon]